MMVEYLLTDPVYFFRFTVIIILSITLHELGHGFAAIHQGDDTPIRTGHMTPNPVVHMGWLSLIFLCLVGMAWGEMPINPNRFRSRKWGEILVAAAGPGTNFAIAVVCIFVIHLIKASSAMSFLSLEFFWLAAYINIGLGFFNLLPIPPLDGFHIFSELIPDLKPLGQSQIGYALLMILFITGASGLIWSAAEATVTIWSR
ncbi:site-2 protease family protein [Nodosilinea sp. FACHB-131]|uniref:site-2 protease family protein n=1 Tax=Cyanophyceae TaxID=3028117 RepID=UPI001686C5F7|nr:site-2 protease family protein [Nodosilinea sp. FACHB-131]MBD1874224.1 site-2 protease family protein [Nodosilinea sp. FACHB-131]